MEGARAPAPPKDGTKSLPKPVEPARVRSSGGWSGTPARKVEGGSVEVGSAEGGSSEGGSAEGGSGGGANVSMAAPIPMAFSAAAGRTPGGVRLKKYCDFWFKLTKLSQTWLHVRV